jgi:hypothetical protein
MKASKYRVAAESMKLTIIGGKVLNEETLNGSFIVFPYFITS